MPRRRPGESVEAYRSRNRSIYEGRVRRAREQGYSSPQAATRARRAIRSQEGLRPLRVLPAGVDVSPAGTQYEGNRTNVLARMLRDAARTVGRDAPVSLRVRVGFLAMPDSSVVKGAAPSGGFGNVESGEEEVKVSLSGERDPETGQWMPDTLTLGDMLRSIDDQSGDVREGMLSLVVSTTGVDDADNVTGWTLSIPGYYGG